MLDQRMHDQILANIQGKYGVHLTGVFGTEREPTPSFVYTTGLTETRGFELLMIGLKYEHAGALLNDIAAKLNDGMELEYDKPDHRWANLPIAFKRVTHPDVHRKYVCVSDAYYGADVNVVQVVMSDRDGFLPWEAGYEHSYMDRMQPLLF